MKYDIFISYRRDGGYDTAKHLNDLLVRDGYKVSFDIDTLRSGNFDTQLLSRIEQCKDFILIVDQHAFDRTLDPNFDSKNDWLRCELAHALKKDKNIIPIFLSGVNGFPHNLPEDIADVAKKNGPEYNRYHFNAFYADLKKRFLHKKTRWSYIVAAMLIIISIIVACILLNNISQNNSSYKEEKLQEEVSENHIEEIDNVDRREEALKLFCGNFSIVAPGAMKDGITWVYEMELDPINSSCEWVEEGLVNIKSSKGWCGTTFKMTEVWDIYNFSLHNSLKYAIAEMRQVDEFYEGENHVCKVKLELDDYNNIVMSYIDGNEAPAPLYDGDGGFKEAIFYRD